MRHLENSISLDNTLVLIFTAVKTNEQGAMPLVTVGLKTCYHFVAEGKKDKASKGAVEHGGLLQECTLPEL